LTSDFQILTSQFNLQMYLIIW